MITGVNTVFPQFKIVLCTIECSEVYSIVVDVAF
jgi:hypothetical protein